MVRGILAAASRASPIEISGVAERVSALVRPRAAVPCSIRRYYTSMRALERTRERRIRRDAGRCSSLDGPVERYGRVCVCVCVCARGGGEKKARGLGAAEKRGR